MNKKLWGGRFSQQTNALVESFSVSIQVDKELAQDDILGSLAHISMLHACKLINEQEYKQIQQGLLILAKKIADNQVVFEAAYEDIHMNIEHLLTQEIGQVAGKLHTARSRNDQVALDLHLYLRRQTISIIELLLKLQDVLLYRAKCDKNSILPGYTHLQRAQPIYLAKHWLAYVAMLQRDIERLQDCWQRINRCPLGAGALAGTCLPIDRLYVAKKLHFDDVYYSTLDAVSDRDFVLEFLSAASMIMMHMSRLSEELILWSSQEFNFIELDDAFCTGSSMMPQKKNPDVAELTRGKVGKVYGALFNLFTIMKGLPLAYNRDMQEDKEPLFDTVKTLQQVLTVFSPMLNGLKVNKEKMYQAAKQGFSNATALADYLVKKNMPFRQAHEVVGKLVAYCLSKNCNLEDLSLDELAQFSDLISDDVYQMLNLDDLVKTQDTFGYTQNSALEMEAIVSCDKLKATQIWLQEAENRLEAASVDLMNR